MRSHLLYVGQVNGPCAPCMRFHRRQNGKPEGTILDELRVPAARVLHTAKLWFQELIWLFRSEPRPSCFQIERWLTLLDSSSALSLRSL